MLKRLWLFVLTKEIWMYSLSRANVLILQAAKHNEIAAWLQMCNHSSETLLTDQYIPAQKGLCAIVRSTANANHQKNPVASLPLSDFDFVWEFIWHSSCLDIKLAKCITFAHYVLSAVFHIQ